MSACCFPFHGQHSPQRTDRIGTNSTDKMVHSYGKIYANMNAETTAIDKTFTVRYKSSGKNYPQQRLALNLLQGNLSSTKVFKSGGIWFFFRQLVVVFYNRHVCVLTSFVWNSCLLDGEPLVLQLLNLRAHKSRQVNLRGHNQGNFWTPICHATWPSPVIADNRSNSQVNYLSL